MRIEIVLSALLLACGKVDLPVADGGGDALDIDALVASPSCMYAGAWPNCDTLPPGPIINVGCTSTPPTPQGGPLVDGVYQLVQIDWDATKSACETQTRRGQLEVCGDTIIWTDVQPEIAVTYNVDAKVKANGVKLEWQDFCTDTQTFAFDYTASGTDLVIFFAPPTIPDLRLIMRFAKQ